MYVQLAWYSTKKAIGCITEGADAKVNRFLCGELGRGLHAILVDLCQAVFSQGKFCKLFLTSAEYIPRVSC